MEKSEVIKSLIDAGAESVKNLVVKNVTVTPQENYTRVALTIDKPIKGMVQNDKNEWVEGETKVIFVSAYSIASLLKDNDDAAFAVNHILENPNSLMVILAKATINILIESVTKGQAYKNPWSESDKSTVFDHDTFIDHITSITLTEKAISKLDKIADSLLGI